MIKNQDNGIIKGQIDLKIRILSNGLPPDRFKCTWDLLYPGLGNFSKGLIIGEVERIEQQENELLKIATIKPAVDFQRLEEVFIIVKKPDNELLMEEEN